MSDNNRINELIDTLGKLLRAYNDLISAANNLPTVGLVQLLKKIAAIVSFLRGVPKQVWEALWYFVRCDFEKLGDLTVEEIKQLIETLKKLAEVEVAALISQGELSPEDQQRKEELEAWIEHLCDKLEGWDGEMAHDAAVAIAQGLKDFLLTHYPAILAALVQLFGDDVKGMIEKLATGPGMIKRLVKKLIEKILEKIGTEAAKKLIPWVGVILTAAELAALLAILEALDTLQKMVDATLAHLIKELIACGLGMIGRNDVWFQGNSFCDAKISAKPRLKCGKQVDGVWVFSDECAIDFENGDSEKKATLSKKPPLYDKATNTWTCPFEIDAMDVSNAPCAQGAELCILYLDVTITDKNGNTTSHRLVVGAGTP